MALIHPRGPRPSTAQVDYPRSGHDDVTAALCLRRSPSTHFGEPFDDRRERLGGVDLVCAPSA